MGRAFCRWRHPRHPQAPIVIRSIEDLAAAIAHRRMQVGLTQLELDDVAGVQEGYTSKIERGTKTPVGQTLSWYLEALKVGLVMQPLQGVPLPTERREICPLPQLPLDLPTRRELRSRLRKAQHAKVKA